MSTENADTIVLRGRDIFPLLQALRSLDGYHDVVDGKALVRPFAFSGVTRVRLARWLQAVMAQHKVLSDTHDALVRQYTADPSDSSVPEDRIPAFTAEWEKALDENVSFSGTGKISVDDLSRDGNPIPITVLNAMLPILE